MSYRSEADIPRAKSDSGLSYWESGKVKFSDFDISFAELACGSVRYSDLRALAILGLENE